MNIELTLPQQAILYEQLRAKFSQMSIQEVIEEAYKNGITSKFALITHIKRVLPDVLWIDAEEEVIKFLKDLNFTYTIEYKPPKFKN